MDTNQTPQVPDFSQKTVTTAQSSAPTPSGKAPFMNKKMFGLFFAIIIAIAIPVVSYYVYNQSQTTKSEASLPAPLCHNYVTPPGFKIHRGCYACNMNHAKFQKKIQDAQGRIPAAALASILNSAVEGWILVQDIPMEYWNILNCPDPLLRDPNEGPNVRLESAWAIMRHQCTAPPGDHCKKKGIHSYECRPGGFIFACTSPTPSPPTPQGCPAPSTCVDQKTAVAQGCATVNTTAIQTCQLSGPASTVLLTGVCCTPKTTVICEAPRTCLKMDPASNPDLSQFCEEGSISKDGTNASCTNGSICCIPKKVTPSPTPSPTPTMTPTPTVTPTATPGPSATMPPQCIEPKISVEVECLTCGGQ